MKKNLSRIVLGISLIGMLVMVICMVILFKDDVQVENISGDRKVLGDMNILFQKRAGLYDTDEIIITKDEININENAKQGYYITNIDKKNIDNRDLLECSSGKNLIFENNEEIGTVYVSEIYNTSGDSETNAMITIKNKKTNEFETFDISLGSNIHKEKKYTYATVPIKVNDSLYIVTGHTDMNENYEDKGYQEDGDESYVRTAINLYKINLSNRTSKHIINKEYKGDQLNIISDIAFSRNNKAYFLVNEKDESSKKYKSYLLEFDILAKDIKNIDLGENIKANRGDISKYYLEGDNILFTITPTKENDKYTKVISVDLKKGKLSYSYNLDLNYRAMDYSIMRVRRDKGKIYLVTHEQRTKEKSVYKSINEFEVINNSISSGASSAEVLMDRPYLGYDKITYGIYVFDEGNGRNLYTGNIKLYSDYEVNVGLVKKGEY